MIEFRSMRYFPIYIESPSSFSNYDRNKFSGVRQNLVEYHDRI
jgi:hypothetical protein